MPRGVQRSRKVKLAAVMAAEMSGVVEAERQTGIPESTIRYWAAKPEFAEVRARTREELENEVKIAAHRLWQRVAEMALDMDPRDAIFGAEKATTILQLLSGSATARTETRDITGSLPDSALIEAIREAERLTSQGRTPQETPPETEGSGL
jgi:hypothetical protein